ncbi:uncharacterized protein magl isoform X2 [Kryptolebias marmoratus]|uniref:uncharacterized protein magl isoform X2 n=1 Tax=Kryptolebias marmoratus TaxID=37003 RepID=UPI0018ACF7CB|nr:uncharacterized protein magl isoform X2 [Kryptolebias marmoratus]
MCENSEEVGRRGRREEGGQQKQGPNAAWRSEPSVMSNSQLPAVENGRAAEEDESQFSAPPPLVPISSASCTAATGPDFTCDSILESKAIAVASGDCVSAISSPAEASPAKPAETSTSTFEDATDPSPATSLTTSASDALKCSATSIVDVADFPPWSPALSSPTFGGLDAKKDCPPVLTFKGISVTLENNKIWTEFSECGTEMILTKQGRRMFPYCRYRLSGLDPERLYSLVLSIVPLGQFKYRWSSTKWEASGAAEHQSQGLIRAFSHHYSPCRGSEWMSCLVSFYKLKLTNNFQDRDGHTILHSMHRYIPRLHVIPLPDGDGGAPTADKPVVAGPESVTFTFPQTEFMAVTTYQNFRITQLKINHNPFAKGFREDGHNPRLYRMSTPALKTDDGPPDFNPAEPREHEEDVMDLSSASENAAPPPSNAPESRLVLKPIMSDLSGSGASYVPCMRGKHALGEVVLVDERPAGEESTCAGGPGFRVPSQGAGVGTRPAPGSSTSAPASGLPYRRKRRRKKVKRQWGMYYRPRLWKAAAAAAATPTEVPSPSLTVAMQPELDDIEGLLFASFTTKEALEVHVRDVPASVSPAGSPVSSSRPAQSEETVEVNPETVEEKVARLESLLLTDLAVLKHGQAVHPVLQEVGLKLSSLDPDVSVDLNYLGVRLPLPPPVLPEHSSTAPPPADEGLPFISRTGKTSDMTKIKGWRNKFIRSRETSASNCDESPKNLSAFCSDMLDEYLESEAQQISERAAAFSTDPESSVVYQLPARSASYVKTLESVLRHRNAAPRGPEGPDRPCPLSRKPVPESSLRTAASPLTGPDPRTPAGPQTPPPSAPPDSSSGLSYSSYVSQRLSTSQAGTCKRSAQSQAWAQKAPGLSKAQLNQVLDGTLLTPRRLTTALTAVVTDQTSSGQVGNAAPLAYAECGRMCCRLGCVCSSLQHQGRGPIHCRRPECMFDCSCSNPGTNVEQTAQPRPGFNAKKLWNRHICDRDSDILRVPQSAAASLLPGNVQTRGRPHLAPQMREEDKDPVYKYLESKLTCARVRAFNSQPPPVVTLDGEISAAVFKPKDATKPPSSSKKHPRPLVIHQRADEHSSNDNGSRRQIHIHSLCQWRKDRKKVLEGLCERMNQDRLHQRFYIGPYCVSPVAKVTLQKPSGSVVIYRVQISKPAQVSDCEEDESDDYYDGDADAEEDDGPAEDPEMWYGATPFLRGVVAAGSLSARKKPSGYRATGLIEVNGKHYNYARLVLGNMGSLHPANRLAAHVTGRLPASGGLSQTASQNQGSAGNANAAGVSACATAPPVVAKMDTVAPKLGAPKLLAQELVAQKLAAQMTMSHPAAELLPSANKAATIIQQPSLNSPPVYPIQLLIPVQPNFQTSSATSPVSLTVSSSLKNPLFLGQSGTYSFRICPPSNQAAGGQNPPGVALPGGFTLVDLPKPGADSADGTNGAAGRAEPRRPTEAASDLRHLAKEWVGFDTLRKVKELLSSSSAEPGSSSSAPLSGKKTPSGENGEADDRQAPTQESNLDFSSEDLSSGFSDDEEFDNDDETVDIETVEEGKHGALFAKMREDATKNSDSTRHSSAESGSLMEPGGQEKQSSLKTLYWRRNHNTLEKQRRSDQRVLYDKLRRVLRSHSKTPVLNLLSLAVQEIQEINDTSKCLEEEKERLVQEQTAYVRKLSLESGKSEILIQNKLKEIFERQKQRERDMSWKPVFSKLLQTKAALLQATAPRSHLQPPQQQQPDPPTHAQQPKAAQSNLQTLLTMLHPTKPSEHGLDLLPGQHVLIQARSLPGQTASVPPPPPLAENQEASGDPSQTNSPAPSEQAPVGATQNGPSPGLPAPNVLPANLITPLPVVRSKTGRLILPSSLKPMGRGFFAFMVVEPKPKDKEGEASSAANPQPSDGEASKSSEASLPPSDQTSDVGSKAAASGSNPRSPGGIPPSAEADTSEKTRDPGSGVTWPPAAARLCFVPHPVVLEPILGSVRGRDGPQPTTGGESDRGGPKSPPNEVDQKAGRPAGGKRCRGRPRKKRASDLKNAAKRDSSDYDYDDDDDDDSPVRFSNRSYKAATSTTPEGEAYTSRPLTRGSLGKDFPSAKKRSWIDVEKELEPELEYS